MGILRSVWAGSALAVLAFGAAQAQQTQSAAERARAAAAGVDEAFVRANAATGREWPSYGLNHSENRFSPLGGVSADNVNRLGLAWSYELGSRRGVQATPVVGGGIMYVTASWSVVHALDARTGQPLWRSEERR